MMKVGIRDSRAVLSQLELDLLNRLLVDGGDHGEPSDAFESLAHIRTLGKRFASCSRLVQSLGGEVMVQSTGEELGVEFSFTIKMSSTELHNEPVYNVNNNNMNEQEKLDYTIRSDVQSVL